MRLPFLAAGSARPLPVTPRPRIVAGQSQAGAATARLGVVRVAARQGQTATAKARPKIVARQGQTATAKARTRIAARQSQRTTATATASLWPNGYRYQHEIRLRAWPGGGAPVPNFLLPFSETLTPFKTVANGGEVEHASGYDIRFETTGGTKLGHILISYNGTTGAVLALVNMPRDFATAQSIYCYTGKSGLVASEESASNARAGGWLAWFKGGSVADLTGNGRNLTASGTPGSTTLSGWPAYDFDGLDDYGGGLAASGFLNGLSAVSCVTLAQADAINQLRGLFNVTNATEMELGLRYKGSAGRLVAAAKFGTSSYLYESADNSQATSPQAVAFVASSGAAMRMAINGAMDTPSAGSGTLAGTLSVTDALEWGRGGIGSIGYWNGPAAFLALRSGAMSNAELESMTAALSDPRLVYGVGSANLVTSSARAPVALPVFASVSAGTPADINVGATGYDQNGDTLSVTDAAVVSGAATITVPSGGLVRLTGNSGLEQRIISEGGLRDPAGGRSRWRLYATATVPIIVGRPKVPPSVAAARQWWIGGGGPQFSQSPATLAAAMAGAADGDHIYLPAGNTALGTLSGTRSATTPLVIRGRPMAAGSKAPTSIITGKTVLSGRGYWLYELQTSYAGSDRHNADIHITGSYMTVTRCWLTGREGMQIVNPAHHCDIGWNRFTGRNTPTGGTTAAPTAPNCFQFEITVPGSFPTQTSGPYNIACYRNFFWDDTNHGLYGTEAGGESMCCYVGNDHPGPDDLGTLLNVVFEENFYAKAGGRKRSLYSKRGCDMIRNRSVHTSSIFGQRHGWGSKIYGNRVTDTDLIVIGDDRAGSYAAGNDLRNNVAGGTIRLGRAYNSPSGSPYQAADWTTMFKNNGKVTVGYITAAGVPTTDMGGILSNVRIYQYTGTITEVPGNYDPATYVKDTGNPLGLTDGADLIAATFADADVGFEVASQGL